MISKSMKNTVVKVMPRMTSRLKIYVMEDVLLGPELLLNSSPIS